MNVLCDSQRSAFCHRAIWSGRNVNCATHSSIRASVSFVPTKPKGKFTGSATDAKGPIVHQGLITASDWRAKGKLSCSDMTQGARDNTVKRDSQRWEHAAALCFHLTTLEGSHFVGVSGFAPDTQRLRSHKSYKLINKTNPLPVIIFSFVLISFTKPRCVSVYTPSSPALSPSPALSASHRCSEADQTPAWICAPLKSGISMCI